MASWRHAVLEDQVAERHDEAGRLGDRDELVGSDDATIRMVPARERFEPGDVERGEIHDRLVHDLDLARARARSAVLPRAPSRCWTTTSIAGSNCSSRPRPSRFAAYRAMSAWRSRSVGLAPSRTRSAPTEHPSTTARPATMIGAQIGGRQSLRRSSRPRRARGASARRIANSSPPMRATRSAGRTVARRRRDTSTSTSSPAWWPSASFTALNPSRSSTTTAPTGASRRFAYRLELTARAAARAGSDWRDR